MNVARPPEGFRVTVAPDVVAYINAEAADNFRVRQCWVDLLGRIAITGLREGTILAGNSPPRFLFVADGAPTFNVPTIKIIYSCFGDTLHVTSALVCVDGEPG